MLVLGVFLAIFAIICFVVIRIKRKQKDEINSAEETFDVCAVLSHYSEGDNGFATILLDKKQVLIKGDRMTVLNLISLIQNNSKQIINS